MNSSSTILLQLTEEKISKYKEDIKNREEMSKKIMDFLIKEYEEIFPELLIMPKKQFILNIKKGAYSIMEDLYTDIFKEDPAFQGIFNDKFQTIKEKYKDNYHFLNNEWINNKNKNENNYLCKYRKHCFNDSEYASHNCSNIDTKFIIISNDNNKDLKFVICSNCQKVYKSSFILCKCFHCDEEYYSEQLPDDQNLDLFQATWKEYHCPQLISNNMSCIKCKSPFYLNMKTGMLNCINKSCNFISKPKRILWSCINCKEDFTSEAKVYNPLDKEIFHKAIKQTLILKHRAHPKKMPCCKINVFFTEFYHKKSCRGILYLWEINDKLIIVCEKCNAINYYERFIWTCPICQTKFRARHRSLIPNENNENRNDNENKNEKKVDKKENKKDIKENKAEIKDNNIANNKDNINNDNKYFKNEKKSRSRNNNKDNYNQNKTDINEPLLINNDKKVEQNDNIFHKIDNNIIKNENVDNKTIEDDLHKIIKNTRIKAVINSPVKKRKNLKIKNNYQSSRFRRQGRLKTDKGKSLNFTTIDENKNFNINNNDYSNKNLYEDKNTTINNDELYEDKNTNINNDDTNKNLYEDKDTNLNIDSNNNLYENKLNQNVNNKNNFKRKKWI